MIASTSQVYWRISIEIIEDAGVVFVLFCFFVVGVGGGAAAVVVTAYVEGMCLIGSVELLASSVNSGEGVWSKLSFAFLRSSYLKAYPSQRSNCKRGEGFFESGIRVKRHVAGSPSSQPILNE